jgi:hypothetical protein
MKRALATSLVFLLSPCLSAADDAGTIIGGVEAVFHEGAVTFTVIHPEAVSSSVRVYDLDSDALVFDSGARARTQLAWQAGHDFDGGYRYLVTAWNADGEVVVSQAAANSRQVPISEISFDTVPGGTEFAGPDEIDLLADVNVGSIPGVRLYEDYGGKGGGIELYDEGGFSRTAYILPTGSTTGGQVRVLGPSGFAWLQGEHPLHGNEAALSVFGTSSFYVWAGETGDDSVVMPEDAVSAAETRDEAGVVSGFTAGALTLPQDGYATIESRTISAPTNGYVFGSAMVRAILYKNDTSHPAAGACSISIEPNVFYTDGGALASISFGGTGTFQFSLSPSRVIPVSAGSNEIYLVCWADLHNTVQVYERHLHLLFVPTAYGTVPD